MNTTTDLTTYDGLRLHVRVEGPDDADLTVVLAHCWTSDHDSWRYQVRDLRAHLGPSVRLVTYDHRGHGASDETPEHAATVANLGRDLSDVVDTYAPHGPLVLAGHSIGGMTIMALAERRPELFTSRVAGVLLVSTAGGDLESVTLGLPEIGTRAKAHIPRMLALRSRMLSRRRRRKAPYIESLVARRLLFGDDMRLRDHMLTVEGIINTPAASMCGFYTDVMTHERHAALAALEGIPTHVLVGSEDRLTPLRHARRLAAAIPGAELTVAPGAGHMLPLERDALVSGALVTMVERSLAGAQARLLRPTSTNPSTTRTA
ncbi:MAG: alpha/beta fold hydrolase [Nocardioidaceae bacterium]